VQKRLDGDLIFSIMTHHILPQPENSNPGRKMRRFIGMPLTPFLTERWLEAVLSSSLYTFHSRIVEKAPA
jgi:hypothetical protein